MVLVHIVKGNLPVQVGYRNMGSSFRWIMSVKLSMLSTVRTLRMMPVCREFEKLMMLEKVSALDALIPMLTRMQGGPSQTPPVHVFNTLLTLAEEPLGVLPDVLGEADSAGDAWAICSKRTPS